MPTRVDQYNTVVYYVDGQVTAPGGLVGENSRGVQAIVQDHPQVGREIVTGGDYYIRSPDGRWYPVDINGLFQWLLDCPDVAMGQMCSHEEYSAIMAKVNADKSGYTARERKP